MNRFLVFIIMILCLVECGQKEESKYLRWVGDSVFNPHIDSEAFQICGSESDVQQYFHFSKGLFYKGEKKTLRDTFLKQYNPINVDESGWIRIRFIVNCKGESGRFRLIMSDLDYKERSFDSRITDQLMQISKSLEGWEIQSKDGQARDFYQYLIFKISNGKLIEILP